MDGKCAHEQSNLPFIIGTALTVFTLGLGIYLIIFSKTAKSFETAQKSILNKLDTAKNKEQKEERFNILMEGLDEDEKKVIMAVKEQDGIEQSTLRIRAGLSKAKLSILLTGLEKNSLIAKVPFGKKNKIHLKNAL